MLLANGALPFSLSEEAGHRILVGVSYGVGAIGLGLAGLLLWGAIYSAARARLDSSAKVFGRGFLGVSAGVALLIAGLFLVVPFTSERPGRGWAAWLLGGAVTLVLGGEFIVAGRLYARVRRNGGGGVAAALSILSFVIAGLIGLAGLIVGLVALLPDAA